MDKRIFGSIITILILLGVLWVFASTILTIDTSMATGLDYSTTASLNWTAVNGPLRIGGNITMNFTIVANLRNESDVFNISNFTITSTALSSGHLYNLSWDRDEYTDFMGGCAHWNNTHGAFNCTLDDKTGVNCRAHDWEHTNISGNQTISILLNLSANHSTNLEQTYDWIISVWAIGVHGEANFSVTKTISNIGIDDLAPRLTDISITDGTYTRDNFDDPSSLYLLDGVDVVVNITVTDYNREDVYVFWGEWNGSLAAISGVNGEQVGTNWSTIMGTTLDSEYMNMTHDSDCDSSDKDGTIASCTYSATIVNSAAENFTAGTLYTLLFWMNDSFNHEVNFTNSGAGYNLTIDGDDPEATLTMPKVTNVFSGRSITFKCETTDINGISNLGEITITSPNKKETTKTVDNVNHEATFSGVDEIGQAGKYKVTCTATDKVGHTWTLDEQEFRVLTRSGGGGVVAGAPVAGVDISSTDSPSGSVSGIQGESETFTTDGVTAHRLTFVEIGIDYAKMTIESTPIEFTLNIGESKEVDLDGEIVKVTLSSIENGKANVSVTNIEKYEEKLEEERKAREGPAEEGGYGLLITILVIVAIVVIGYLVLKSRKSKKGEVHFTRQDLGL